MRATDAVAFGALVVGFALLATAHLAIVAGLAARAPRSRSLAALVVPPLAVYWAIRERMFARGVAWSVGAAVYLVALAITAR
jgi:hypothetical protein